MIESLKKNFVNNRNIKTLNISLISFKPFYYIDKFKKMNLKGKILIHNNNKKDLNIVIENNKSIYSFTGCSLNKKQLLRFKKI